MAKRRKKSRSRHSKACVRKVIRFRTKRGRTISFTGRHGANCKPRKFSHVLPARLRPYATAMKTCSRKHKGGGKSRLRAIGACIRRRAA